MSTDGYSSVVLSVSFLLWFFIHKCHRKHSKLYDTYDISDGGKVIPADACLIQF